MGTGPIGTDPLSTVERSSFPLPHSTVLKESVPIGSALPDAHFHLGFVADPAVFAEEVQCSGSFVFAASVTPEEYRVTKAALGGVPDGICLAVGLHPWWVPAEESQLNAALSGFDAVLPETGFVGEVGLDFSKRRVETREAQLAAFRHIAQQCAKAGKKVLSVHCVKAYDDALHILKEADCLESCTCIFHWFSGSSQQLQQAIKAGCYFSVGQRMLATKKGREYAKVIPADRLLLETDAPEAAEPELVHPHVEYGLLEMQASLLETLNRLAEVWGGGSEDVAAQVSTNAQRIFG